MSDISEHLEQVLNNLPQQVKLIAVSKTKPIEAIEEAYKAGQRVFGENRVQELVEKYEALPKDIEWHLIGHLQTNKVKYVAPFVAMIHGVESLRLLDTINKEGEKNGRVIPCLLQFHIAEEETKFGLNEAEAKELLESEIYGRMKNIHIVGVMGMATFTEDREQVRKEFHHLKTIFDGLRQNYFAHDPAFKELSMGMSGDYPIAVEEGSTMVRVGSFIFGYRN
ncbi:YggS family pyridoxal phosphate-dependent enzyme [uncultured Sanguibacteroides sp.]|uniref:YggS family pyridoxal phosphate-dependent enzyme n=1 Tax=uncultured Sanguibacteroides sp. TaxID=1635151 RepID=UPI0025F4E1B6|nr:YggS family pyridoxal phosphate-dependent enzyme [uncultured Sanguibacteroides sp.]